MYILNKYGYGHNAYKRGFNDLYNPQSRSLSNELKCITYYMKKNGKTLEEINEYMNKQLKTIYSSIRNNEAYISHRLKMIEREYNSEDLSISFCQKEVDFIKKYNKNEGRIIFYIMCICKMKRSNYINVVNWSIRNEYNDCMNSKSVDNIIRKLNAEKIIKSKMTHLKNGEVGFVTIISEEIINMYDENPIFTFTNIGNIKLLFDYVVGNNKKVIFCEKCGVIVEKTPNKKYCDSCIKEKQIEWQRMSMKNIRCEVNKKP